MDWDRAEKRGHDFSMTYSMMVDGLMLHFVYIVGPNRWKDSLLQISTATRQITGKSRQFRYPKTSMPCLKMPKLRSVLQNMHLSPNRGNEH
jgi:hypothetical protein